jgi:lysine 2,3-aminomutase
VIPSGKELIDIDRPADPLQEQAQSPVPLVIHRYPHKVAFLVSNRCAVHCRFCMRKRDVGAGPAISDENIFRGLEYIRSRRQINEVILTGGDPLMLGDRLLLDILSALRQIRHVIFLRIHTRVPSALPQRITPALAKRLGSFHPVFINIHVNHPAEITPRSAAACALLADAGIPLGSQTVLLRGVNDDPEVLKQLMQGLLAIRVRPYYIHQLDRMPGTGHFQVPLDRAVDVISSLRGPLSGMAVPQFMIDLPGGGGKVVISPEVVIRKENKRWILRNREGKPFSYEWD